MGAGGTTSAVDAVLGREPRDVEGAGRESGHVRRKLRSPERPGQLCTGPEMGPWGAGAVRAVPGQAGEGARAVLPQCTVTEQRADSP